MIRERQSEEIDELAAALAKAQGQMGAAKKSKTAHIYGESKRTGQPFDYTFDFSSFQDLRDVSQKPLSDNGLAVTQTVDDETDGHPYLETMLMHSSGQFKCSFLPLIATSDPSEFTSLLTRYKRHAYAAIIGIANEDEVEDRESGRQSPQKPQKSAQKKQPPKQEPDTPEAKQAFLKEIGDLFQSLHQGTQKKLLSDFGKAENLGAVLPSLRERFKKAVSNALDKQADTESTK